MRSEPSAPEKGAGGETPNEDSASRRRRLKGNQRLACMIAKEWIDGVAAALGRGESSGTVRPLRLLIKGTAGTGKSFVIDRITEYIEEVAARFGWPPRVTAIVAAYTGVAAFNVRGQTLHSVCKLPTDPKDFDDLSGNSLVKLQKDLFNALLLIADERSMVGRRTFSWVSSRLTQAKPDSNLSFGGMGVIKLGDDAQLPPIGDLPMYTRHAPHNDHHTIRGVGLVDEFIDPGDTVFPAVVVLDVLMRQQGTDKQQLRFKRCLTHLRDGSWGASKEESDKSMVRDYSFLRTRRFASLSKEEQHEFRDALRLFATNGKVNDFNRERLRQLPKRCTVHAINRGPGASEATSDKAGGL